MNNENKCFDCGISLADAIALNGVACTIRALIEALNKEGNLIQIDEIKNIIYLCSIHLDNVSGALTPQVKEIKKTFDVLD